MNIENIEKMDIPVLQDNYSINELINFLTTLNKLENPKKYEKLLKEKQKVEIELPKIILQLMEYIRLVRSTKNTSRYILSIITNMLEADLEVIGEGKIEIFEEMTKIIKYCHSTT